MRRNLAQSPHRDVVQGALALEPGVHALPAHPLLVLITWLDSHYVAGWHTDEPSEKPSVCRSVGWLIYDGDKAKTIASHITNEEMPQRCGEMTIPTAAIVRIRVLR